MKRVYLSPRLKVESARAPEVISITTELLSTPDYCLDRYSEAALGHVESFQDFKLLNTSSTTLAGLCVQRSNIHLPMKRTKLLCKIYKHGP